MRLVDALRSANAMPNSCRVPWRPVRSMCSAICINSPDKAAGNRSHFTAQAWRGAGIRREIGEFQSVTTKSGHAPLNWHLRLAFTVTLYEIAPTFDGRR